MYPMRICIGGYSPTTDMYSHLTMDKSTSQQRKLSQELPFSGNNQHLFPNNRALLKNRWFLRLHNVTKDYNLMLGL